QIQELGGRVLPGEISSAVYYYKVTFSDKHGKRLEPEEIQAIQESEISEKGLKRQFVLRYYSVFNIGQTIGLPPD
ncbi:MAG TPA: hypothetical protein VI603_15755, partial [Saprospiraceae bacterium]|nr:hypothetical protein [Saprospiraceae bacterium]